MGNIFNRIGSNRRKRIQRANGDLFDSGARAVGGGALVAAGQSEELPSKVNSPKFEIYKDRKKQYRWRFKARNGKIMADSAESYVRRARAIEAAKTARGLMLEASTVIKEK